MGRKCTAIAAWEDLRLPRDLFHLSPSEVTFNVFYKSLFTYKDRTALSKYAVCFVFLKSVSVVKHKGWKNPSYILRKKERYKIRVKYIFINNASLIKYSGEKKANW